MNAEKAALSYLHTFPTEVQEEGEELRRAGSVKEIYGSFQAFHTRLRVGVQMCQCSFRLNDDGRWTGTIQGRSDSQAPLVASMLTFLDRAGDLPATPAHGDERTLDEMVEEKLGRKLQAKEQDFLAKIESRFTKWQQKGELIDHDMVRLHPRWPVESYEALAYLAGQRSAGGVPAVLELRRLRPGEKKPGLAGLSQRPHRHRIDAAQVPVMGAGVGTRTLAPTHRRAGI